MNRQPSQPPHRLAQSDPLTCASASAGSVDPMEPGGSAGQPDQNAQLAGDGRSAGHTHPAPISHAATAGANLLSPATASHRTRTGPARLAAAPADRSRVPDARHNRTAPMHSTGATRRCPRHPSGSGCPQRARDGPPVVVPSSSRSAGARPGPLGDSEHAGSCPPRRASPASPARAQQRRRLPVAGKSRGERPPASVRSYLSRATSEERVKPSDGACQAPVRLTSDAPGRPDASPIGAEVARMRS